MLILIGLSMNNKTSVNTLLIILIPVISFTLIIVTIFLVFLCAIIRMCAAKQSTSEDPNQQPTYEEIMITQDHNIIISMEGNAAYAHITQY